MVRKIEVVPHQLTWCDAFESESRSIAPALGKNVVALHHIGSTAIPTIHAKPIIDILVEVRDVAEVDERNSAMAALGYEAMGEFGISGRRYFWKDNEAGIRTHHVHVFEVDSMQVKRHLAFRDYMRVHAQEARQYSELKQELARQHPNNAEAYANGKDEFIRIIDRKAAAWQT